MKILGAKIKQARKQKGLSQSQLAQGICTQATVSLIEKNNQLPSMPILTRICDRLDITLTDVIEDDNQTLTAIFNQLDRLFSAGDFEKARTVLNNIGIKQLQDDYDKKRYYYYLGMLAELFENDVDDAIFNFELVAHQFDNDLPDIYAALALAHLAELYQQKNDDHQAVAFVNQALNYLGRLPDETGQHFEQHVQIAQRCLTVLIANEKWESARRLVDETLALIQGQHSTYQLGQMYCQSVAIYLAAGQIELATRQLYLAYSLALMQDDQQLLDETLPQMTQLGLQRF